MILSIRKSILDLSRRFAAGRLTSCSLYHATNDPIYGFEPGTEQRLALDAKLKEYNSKVFEVPIVAGDEEIRTKNVRYQVKPFDHGSKLTKFYSADSESLQKAIESSQKAFRSWDATPLEKRAEIFIRAAELIRGKYRADILAATMLGQSKTIIQAEIDAACELSDFYAFNAQWALEAQKWSPISVGKCVNSLVWRGFEGFWAAIAPFNFTAISGHLAGAPAMMGNVVLWKPSTTAILSSYIVFQVLREAGLPPGVINFVPSEGPVFGETITKSPHLAGINFTGSAKTFENVWKEVANNIGTYKSFPRLIGECGGKNFHFIHPSASNIKHIVNSTIRSAFEYSGQKCSACSRIYVPESKWNAIRDGLVAVVKEMKVGSPLEHDTFMTTVIDRKAFTKIKSYLDAAKSSPHLTIVTGGNCDDSKGYFIEPTIIQTKDPLDKLMQEELFGPVLTAYVYKDREASDVLQLIDTTTSYALTGSVFADDENAIKEASEQLRHSTGNFYVNDKSTGSVVSQQPFGGSRKSGTNDKAGSPFYILRFANLLAVKTQTELTNDWSYPYMRISPKKV